MSPVGPYDALLVVSFGGPEGPDQVVSFLENVLRGRNVPRERLLEVAEHYQHFGGVSPLNDQNRALISAVKAELQRRGYELPIYWGNRNWHPLLPDTMEQMKRDGVRHAVAFCTSAFSSYSGCRQYRENLAAAQQQIGDAAPQIDKLRVFYNHPKFIAAAAARLRGALARLPLSRRGAARLLFTAHSIPQAMAASCAYEAQLREASRLVCQQVGRDAWELVYQSRSGPPTQPWLEPDVLDTLQRLTSEGVSDVVLVPIGFLSDHMEVLYDLDTEAVEKAAELGLGLVRAATVGTHPLMVEMVVDLIEERATPGAAREAIGTLGPSHDICPVDCCQVARQSRPS